MSPGLFVMLFALAMVVRALLALPMRQPGYMDEAYYFVNAATLARGAGLSENFIWNYLAHPTSLPQPGNAYWMPLTSFVVAPFLWMFGSTVRAAQIPMVVLSALLVPLTYALSLRLYQRRDWARRSALLMLASSFYLPYWTAIDGFALFALIGTAIISNLQLPTPHPRPRKAGRAKRASGTYSQLPPSNIQFPISNLQLPISFLAGLLIALAHLTRADGFLLFVPYLVSWWRTSRSGKALGITLVGYLLVMLPWFGRNLLVFGAPLAGGGAVFLRQYDDLFSYEQSLTFEYWLGAGWDHIAQNIARAFLLNLATLMGALHFVFFPFAMIGLWRERRRSIAQATLVYLGVLFSAMTFVFSLSGPRGTFLHSLAAAMPLLYVFMPVGLHDAIAWIAQRRARWNAREAERVLGAAFMLLALLVSASFYRVNVFGDERESGWNERFSSYTQVEEFLRHDSRDQRSPVLCINPPAYVYFNQRAAIAIPSDDPLALVRTAAQFDAHYVVVEPDHPHYLDLLYNFAVPDARFQLRATFADARGAQVQLYQIVPLR